MSFQELTHELKMKKKELNSLPSVNRYAFSDDDDDQAYAYELMDHKTELRDEIRDLEIEVAEYYNRKGH